MSDPNHLRHVQLIRKAALLLAIVGACALAAITKTLGTVPWLHEGVESVGLAMIVICIVGRAWCSLYIGGRKKAEIVSGGPYSLCRNPLYFFSFVGAFGMGAQTGSIVIAGLFFVIAVAVFYVTVRQEEIWLLATFGEPYRAYCERTPRFWPRFSKWHDSETIEVRPVFFLTTLRDGLGFFLAIPIFEALEHAQDVGWVHVLFSMP